MKKVIILLMILLLGACLNYAQNPTDIDSVILQGKDNIRKATSAWNIQQMMGARAFFERLQNDQTYPWLVHYYIGFVDSRIFHYYFQEENMDEAKKFIDDGIEHLEKAIELKEDFADGYVLLGSMLGNKIALNPNSAMTLGQKSGRMIAEAFELDPENPRVSLIAGQSAYFTPEMYGGGKEKALEHLKKAIEFFQEYKPEKPVDPTWGHDEVYAFLGLVKMDQGDFVGAKQSYDKALEINPNYSWVKVDLMKLLEEKMAEEDNKE